MATTIGTFAARACWIACTVWGMTPSSGAPHQLARVFAGDREELLARGGDDTALLGVGLYGDDVLRGDGLYGEAELVGHDRRGVVVDDLVDVGHYPVGHQLLDDLDGSHAD